MENLHALDRSGGLQPLDHGARAREQRALHCVRELLLLLVEPGVVDREGGLRRERRRRLDRLLRQRVAGAEGEDAERRDHLGRQGDGNDCRRPALLEERHERRQELLAPGAARPEPDGPPLAEEPLHVPLAERNGLGEDHAHRLGERSVPNVDGKRQELLVPLVGHPHDRRVEIEHLDDGARERIERLVEPEALREGARHLVERAHAAGRRPLGGERRLALLSETGRLLVELCVLDRDRELSGERGEQCRLVLARRGPVGRIGGEQADDVSARHERNGKRRADPGLSRGIRDHREAPVSPNVRYLEHRPHTRRPERDVEQPVGDACVRAGEASARRLLELALARAAEVDRHAAYVEQLGDALDRDLEGVRDGELRRRLHDHLEERPRPLELERKLARPLAGAQRVRGADAEGREPRELFRLRLLARRMEQLQNAQRRASQGQRGRDGAILWEPGGVSADRAGLGERAPGNLTRRPEIDGGVDAPRGAGDEPCLATLPDDGGRRPGDARGQADDLGRSVFFLQRDRECLTGQLERRTRERGDVATDCEGAEEESGLRGAQLGGESLLRAERLAGTEELERDGVAVRPGRHEEESRRAAVLADAAHRGGGAGKVVERLLRELGRRQHGSVELGRERRRRRDGDRLEPFAAVVERPDERDLGARNRLRGLRQGPQRVRRTRRPGRGRDGVHERRERRGSEAGVLRVDVEQTGHCSKVFRPERAGVSPRRVEALRPAPPIQSAEKARPRVRRCDFVPILRLCKRPSQPARPGRGPSAGHARSARRRPPEAGECGLRGSPGSYSRSPRSPTGMWARCRTD